MYRSLIWKELRETWLLGAVAFLFLLTVVANDVGLTFYQFKFSLRPALDARAALFENASIIPWTAFVAAFLGAVVALYQTLGESVRGTWVFLMHRPMERWRIILCKLAAGAIVVLLASAAPFIFALWRTRPDASPAPFYWWMTIPVWRHILAASIVYLGAFVSGMRPARSYGTKYWPLVAAIVVTFFLGIREPEFGAGLIVILVADALLLAALFDATRSRDYA